MVERIRTYEEFWPYYLSEHRDPRSRRLHFLGTTGFLTACAASAVRYPRRFPFAAGAFTLLMRDGMKREGEKPPFAHVAAMLGAGIAGAPTTFPFGVAFAYGCAWFGHFKVEGNRPATFEYPLWSLYSDFRMFGLMCQGKLWSGDPLEELGLEEPLMHPRDPEPAPASAPDINGPAATA